MKIPLVGPSGVSRSPSADNERTVNAYLELDAGNQRAAVAMYGMPGLLLDHDFTSAPTEFAPVRGVIKVGDISYWVVGSSIYQRDLQGNYNRVTGGPGGPSTISSSSGPVSMATDGDSVYIVDGVLPWQVFGLIMTPDFAPSRHVKKVAFINGYWVIWGDGTQQFYWLRANSLGGWNSLDFASAEGNPDELVGGVVVQGQLWFVGSMSTEVFTNVADPDLPFQRSGASLIEYGTPAPNTVQYFDNKVVWLARDEKGEGMFVRTQGGNPERFSTHKVEKAIRTYTDIRDAVAWTFQMDGHNFYVCTFPTADATWVYDAASDVWFEWLYRAPDGTLHAHRAICHVATYDIAFIGQTNPGKKHLVGDRTRGKIYELRMDAYDDAGEPILFLRRTADVYDEGNKLTMQELHIDMERAPAGSGATMDVRVYRDGITASAPRSKSMEREVRLHALGQGTAWAVELQTLAPVRRAIFGGYARVTKSRGGT